MMWSYRHDLQLCREIAFQNPFKFKFGSRERRQCWDSIADVLNDAEQPRFNVDQRGVRKRYSKQEKNFKKRMASDGRASGIIGDDISELDQAIETILGLIEAADLESVKSMEKKQRSWREKRRQLKVSYIVSDNRFSRIVVYMKLYIVQKLVTPSGVA